MLSVFLAIGSHKVLLEMIKVILASAGIILDIHGIFLKEKMKLFYVSWEVSTPVSFF